MEEFHSRKVERRETGEASRGHDQPVSVVVANEELSITIHENEIYSTSFEKENFKKLKEAQVKGKYRWTTKPKIQKVVLICAFTQRAKLVSSELVLYPIKKIACCHKILYPLSCDLFQH